jgi:hypothetical protein
MFKCISPYSLLYLPWYYPCISYFSCTWWVLIITVSNLAIFPCYSNLLLRRRRWTGILQWGALGYMLPWLQFLWSYGVFCYSVLLRVVIILRDIIYVIIILHSWHLVICEHFWPYVWNNWSWVMHTMSTWFWHKNRVWQLDTYIAPRPSHPDSIIASMTRHLHHVVAKSPLVAPSPEWLDNIITSMTRHLHHATDKSPQ